MTDKFRVEILQGPFQDSWPEYFDNFWCHCDRVASANRWATITVANRELRRMGGRLIQTKTQGWYFRWDQESGHTAFVLKWS